MGLSLEKPQLALPGLGSIDYEGLSRRGFFAFRLTPSIPA
jgi:hypothetical protein